MLVNLLAEMQRYQVSAEMVANVTGKSARQVKGRLKGKVEISSDDIKKIRDEFFPLCSLDYLLSEHPVHVVPVDERRPA